MVFVSRLSRAWPSPNLHRLFTDIAASKGVDQSGPGVDQSGPDHIKTKQLYTKQDSSCRSHAQGEPNTDPDDTLINDEWDSELDDRTGAR